MLHEIDINEVVEQIENTHQVKVSQEAKQLIRLASEAMTDDPYPLWMYNLQFRQAINSSTSWIEDIQKDVLEYQLNELAESLTKKDRGKITFFHVLHWMADAEFFKGWPVPKDAV